MAEIAIFVTGGGDAVASGVFVGTNGLPARLGAVRIGGRDVALTRGFRERVKARADRDPVFRAGLYQEAVHAMLDGDFGTAKCLLRDVINATLGFAQLGSRVDIPEKSLMRMFGPEGNPRAENLIAVVAALREECQLSLTVRAVPLRARGVRMREPVAP